MSLIFTGLSFGFRDILNQCLNMMYFLYLFLGNIRGRIKENEHDI